MSAPAYVPFRIEAYYDATDAALTTSTAVTSGTCPTYTVGASPANHRGGGNILAGIVELIGIRLNPTNAVTADFELVDDQAADGTMDLRTHSIFRSWDNPINSVADLAANTEYWWHGLRIPFYTPHSLFYQGIEWSGAPGNTTGFIVVAGERVIT